MMKRNALRIFLLALVMLAIAIPACADVWLPASLTEIEAQAFMNASWLSGNCTIPEGVKSIGAQAFYNCSGITSLNIPASVKSIGSQAFAGCTGLTGTITIPAGCEIADDAFDGCTANLTVIAPSKPADLFTWTVSNGKVTITGFEGGKDVTSVHVPAMLDGCPVTTIGAYAFSSNRYLTSVTLPDTLTAIGEHAFSYCSRLERISIPTSVRSIGENAFYYSAALNGSISLVDASIPSNAFTGCRSLSVYSYTSNSNGTLTLSRYYGSQSSVSVPRTVGQKTVTAIGREAFAYLTGLNTVSLPATITTIGQSAFYYCTGLNSVSIPESVTSIGANAFYYCSSLSSANVPAGCSSIGSMAFYGCTNLNSSFTFVDASVNSSAFSGCPNVTVWCFQTSGQNATLLSCRSGAASITVPSQVKGYKVTGMQSQAFYGCTNLTSVVLPETFASIPVEGFYKCTSLKSISIPGSVQTIGENAFYGCTSLTSVSIPASVKSVGSKAFNGCTALTSLNVASASTSLGSYAFSGCTNLSDVSIPGYAGVGNMCFYNTSWLRSQVTAVAKRVTSGCSSQYDKALALHDWVTKNTTYDESYSHYGAEGILFHGIGTCNSYAVTYGMLLDAAGIENRTVTGTATSGSVTGSHAWNLVKLDGKWVHVDTTWDDPLPGGRERHTYFGLTDAQMAKDHSWNTANYPATNGTAVTTASRSVETQDSTNSGETQVTRKGKTR